MLRRGFTLIELLVASGVFVFGFSAAFAMFLTGTKYRTQADALLRLSLASSSLVEEIRLDAGRTPASPKKSQDSGGNDIPGSDAAPFPALCYVGDGFPANDTDTLPKDATTETDSGKFHLFPYRGQPGVWYRVMGCNDETARSDSPQATALNFDLLVIWNLNADEPPFTLGDLNQRLRLVKASPAPVEDVIAELVRRGLAVRQRIIIVRQPSWLIP